MVWWPGRNGALAIALLLGCGLVAGCSDPAAEPLPRTPSPPCPVGSADCMPFEDIAAEVGLTHTTGAELPPEVPGAVDQAAAAALPASESPMGGASLASMRTMTGGVSVADINRDGWMDLYFADVGPDFLYLGSPGGHFRDVSAWLGDSGDGEGRSGLFFDYDGDGFVDLFIANVKDPSRLLRNERGKGFTDVTEEARLGASSSAHGASAADIDNDGDLDFVVPNYTPWYERNTNRTLPVIDVVVPNFLYRNDGDGTFTEVSRAAGFDPAVDGPTLGASFADYDADGDQDLFFTNDFGSGDNLWENDGYGHFHLATQEAGIWSHRDGMGSTWADVNGDGWLDVYVSNIDMPGGPPMRFGNALFLGGGEAGTFTDHSQPSGTAEALWAWGSAAFDAESDGDVDLFVPNGFQSAVPDPRFIAPPEPDAPVQHRPLQPNVFFVNAGNASFTEQAKDWGVGTRIDGRASATFDLEGDGDLDLITTGIYAPPELFENRHPQGNHLRLWLEGEKGNPDAIGAMAWVRGGNLTLVDHVAAGTGYISQEWNALDFGLGNRTSVDVEVMWPGGERQDFEDVEAGTYTLKKDGGLKTGRQT